MRNRRSKHIDESKLKYFIEMKRTKEEIEQYIDRNHGHGISNEMNSKFSQKEQIVSPFFLPFTGLHCMHWRPCSIPSTHCWTLPNEAFPQGILPNC